MSDVDPRPELVVRGPGAPHVMGAPTAASPAGVDPLTAPLTYPGTPPWRPAVLVTDDVLFVLQPQDDAPLGEWLLQTDTEVSSGPDGPAVTALTDAVPTTDATTDLTSAAATIAGAGNGRERRDLPLDEYLRDVGGSPAASLTPVLAVGSNASPAQLRRKLINAGLSTLVPVTAVSVRGLAVGVSAHVSRPGYLPATPIPSADADSDLWVLWLDEVALAAVDATEPNYDRVLLPDWCPVRLTTGQPVTGCWVYLSRHGYLLNEAGEPRRLTDQPTLISALLAEIPALPTLAGTSPQQWIERTRDAAVRDTIREAFGSMGLVRRATEL